MSVVTRCVVSKNLTAAKYTRLKKMAHLCGAVRDEAWRRYGGLNGLGKNPREIRNQDWMREDGLGATTQLPARIWKATLEDVLNAIKASRAASISKCTKKVWRSKHSEVDKKSFSAMLYHETWTKNNLLHRLMRRHWLHGKNHTYNQIVFDIQGYTCFTLNSRCWIKVSSLRRGRRIAIPLDSFKHQITGAIRIRIRDDGEVDILYTVDEMEACVTRPCGHQELGIDKGFSEVFTDSDGQRHGADLGKLLTQESDHLQSVYAARQKIAAIAKKTKNAAKAQRIRKNNLGRKKLNARRRRYRQKVRAKIFAATHAIFDKAHSVVVENLTQVIRGYDRGRKMNRRLASWVKGFIQQAIESVSRRRGASVNLVNAAYTSQWLPNCSAFGKRIGEFIYCPLGKGVFVADHIAAVNVLQRKDDTGISRYLCYREVKKILEERCRQTERPCIALGQCPVPFGHA